MAVNVTLVRLIIRLINGEDILGEVTRECPETITLKNPVRVIVMPNKIDPKTPNVGFAPWAEFSDDREYTFTKSHILCTMSPIKEFVRQYNTMFGGIIAPSSKLLVPGS